MDRRLLLLLGLELRLRLGCEVRLDPLGPAPAPAPAARGLGLLRRTGPVPSRRLGIDNHPPASSAARSALATAGAACGTRAVAPVVAGGGTRLGAWPAGQGPTVPAARTGPRAAIATGAAGTRTALAWTALTLAARPRAAVAPGTGRAAPARPIALPLPAAGPALPAAFLWRWGVLKNPRTAPGRTGPPDRLTGGRLGRPRDLPLRPVTGGRRAAVGRLLRTTRRGLLPSGAPAPLRAAAGSLMPAGTGGLLARGLLPAGPRGLLRAAAAGLLRFGARGLLARRLPASASRGALRLGLPAPGLPRLGLRATLSRRGLRCRGRRLAVGLPCCLRAVARGLLRRDLRLIGGRAVAEGARGLGLFDARGRGSHPEAGLLEDGQGLLRGDSSLLCYLVDALLCHSRTKSMVSCCTVTGARNERASGRPDPSVSAHSGRPHT
jgi:hypothetical protein